MIGFLNIIKPTGVSSGLIVNKVKRLTKEKVGHLGTLDPAASGVLSLAIGKATRFFDYFLNKDKQYVALAKFGVLTDTLDSEGTVVVRDNKIVSLQDVQNAANSLIGECDQMPPLYSSKSVGGIRAYQAARDGKEIDLSPKKVQIYDIKVEKSAQNNLFRLKIHCSSGTYVRSIVRDIAEKLGTIATTVSIIRTKSGAFKIEDACTFEEFEKDIDAQLIKINDILCMETMTLNEKQCLDLVNGKSIKVDKQYGEYLTFYGDSEFSLVECKNGLLKNKIYLYEGEING